MRYLLILHQFAIYPGRLLNLIELSIHLQSVSHNSILMKGLGGDKKALGYSLVNLALEVV